MICRLCLIESDDSIDIFSEDKIPENITKFLQLKLSREDPVSKVICPMCWQELENIQNFCLRIEEAQKVLPAYFKEFKINVEEMHFVAHNNSDMDLVNKEPDLQKSTATLGSFDTLPYFEIIELHKEEIIDPVISLSQETGEIISTKEKPLQPAKWSIDEEEPVPETVREDNTKVKTNRIARKRVKQTPTIEKTTSERTRKLLETSQKFDQIIKENMTLICDICGVKLIDFAQLKTHFRRLHNRKGYAVCCNKRMHKRHLVVDHISSHDGTAYTCNVCGKNASSKDALRSHLKYVHLTKREFPCSFCDKAFKKAIDLKEHTATHTGEVLYMCPHCPKTFTSRATMHGHRKEKHRAEWEANKRCSYF